MFVYKIVAMFTHLSLELTKKHILVLSDEHTITFSSLDRSSTLLTLIFKSDAQVPQIGPITPVLLVLPSPNEIPFFFFRPTSPTTLICPTSVFDLNMDLCLANQAASCTPSVALALVAIF